MKYLELLNTFKNSYVFTIQDIKNIFKKINYVQIHSWIKEGKIIRLAGGKFILPDKINPNMNTDLMLVANELKNSYISLESALSYYQIIPEAVFKITSITTERPEVINNNTGIYVYHRISPLLFNNYTLIDSMVPERKIKIASKEKALFDFVYLKSVKLNDFKDIEKFRFNTAGNILDIISLTKYSDKVKSTVKKHNINLLIRYMQNAQSE
jgi:predicted transcriptional regulator of viral defense system